MLIRQTLTSITVDATETSTHIAMRSLRRQVEQVGESLSQGRIQRIKSPVQVTVGYLATAVAVFFALILLVLAGDPGGPSELDAWEVLMILFVPGALCCWISARYSWMEIGSSGIRVVNPLNEAVIPWSMVRGFDAETGYFRVVTKEWSIRSWAIQDSNLESSSRAGRVEELVSVMSDYRAASAYEGWGREAEANKRWRIPLRPVAGSVAIGLLSGALLWLA